MSVYAFDVVCLEKPIPPGTEMEVAGLKATWVKDPSLLGGHYWLIGDEELMRAGVVYALGGCFIGFPDGTEQRLVAWLDARQPGDDE